MAYTKSMKKIFLIPVFFTLCIGVFSQSNNNELYTADDSLGRPSVALVLSGAGPKGFGHIAIIELMEELGIPIDLIIGTSSGAIVGGLYSAGYSGSEIANEVVNIDWPMLIQDFTSYPLEGALGSHSAQANLINLQLNSDLSLNLGRGLLSGQYVYNKLKSLTLKIPSYISFDELPTAFRATAVDLLTGELVLMEEGDIVEAMRSSMSLPGAFEPFPVDGRYYLDGFIRNTLPISVAKDLGYDIIIAVEIADEMALDVDKFNSNPVTVINQVMALQQAVVTEQEYQYADLVLFPDLNDFTSMDYGLAKEIYEAGKIEAERFRGDLTELRDKVFPEISNGSVGTGEGQKANQIYMRDVSYSEMPSIVIDEIAINNAYSTDERFVRKETSAMLGKALAANDVELLLQEVYDTGNYAMITSRIDTAGNTNVLELNFYKKDQNAIQFGVIQTFEGTVSNSSSWEINLGATMQFRDIWDLGGILSLRSTFLSTSGIDIMYLQPLNEREFLKVQADVYSLFDFETSGFRQKYIQDSFFRQGNLTFSYGNFFSPKHKLLSEVGIHWIDSTQANTNVSAVENTTDSLQIAFTLDALARYTFSTLDYPIFPTKGFSADTTIMGVFPIQKVREPMVFDVVRTDITAAIPVNKNFSMIINGYLGTNISGGLINNPGVITKYGYSTYDRTYFPHVMQRYVYGIHKLALKTDFQIQPNRQITVLGGQFFVGLGGAVGGVWNDYQSITKIENLEWQSSVLAGIRIQDSIGVNVRVGAGRYDDGINPFISLDFASKFY